MIETYSEIFNRPLEKGILIAEIGVNHEGNLDKAIEMIDQVKNAGGDAVKFQSYKAKLLARKDSKAYWDTSKEKTKSQYELFSKFDKFDEKEFKILAKHCKDRKIVFMSTPFDSISASYINEITPIHKIASVDITNHILLNQISRYKKPIILSTGASNINEIKEATKLCFKNSSLLPSLLHCVVNYPTSSENANLSRIKTLKKEFRDYLIGYSDHTLPDKNMFVCTQAFNYGALIIEKHFTFDKSLNGNDHYHSMDKNDLSKLRSNLESSFLLSGSGLIDPKDNEIKSIMHARRSLTSKILIKKGSIICEEMLIPKRPGNGIPPSKINNILGRKVKRDIPPDKEILWEDLYE